MNAVNDPPTIFSPEVGVVVATGEFRDVEEEEDGEDDEKRSVVHTEGYQGAAAAAAAWGGRSVYRGASRFNATGLRVVDPDFARNGREVVTVRIECSPRGLVTLLRGRDQKIEAAVEDAVGADRPALAFRVGDGYEDDVVFDIFLVMRSRLLLAASLDALLRAAFQ